MCLVKIFIVREYLGKFFRHVRMNFALDVENIIGYMTKNGDINMKRMEKYPILNHLKAAKIQTKHAPNFSKSDNNKSIIIFFNHNES